MAAVLFMALAGTSASAQMTPDRQAELVINGARRAYNEKNYAFAAERFREFLQKYGGHKDAPSARYGLALCLLDGTAKDFAGAANELNQIAGNKALPEYPFTVYYLGLALRGQGVQALEQAIAKPGEASHHRGVATQRFDEAAATFARAAAAFGKRIPPAEPKGPSKEREWAGRARCDQAEMLLRQGKAMEAQAVAASFLLDEAMQKSRYRGLALYYHGFASFQLKDYLAAGRSLGQLVPFNDPVYGSHARYLLGRIHHETGKHLEARENYDGVLADHAKQKQAATEALAQSDRFKNDPDEKTRLERQANGPAPDHVARAAFFLGVLLYEDGRFAEALERFGAFAQLYPGSPLGPDACLRQGFCQVQLKQYAEALRTLQPLPDKEPRLADQALHWTARAQVGAADATNPQAYDQAIKAAHDTYRRAADRAQQLEGSDPEARSRRGQILADLAEAQQLVKQHRETAGTYNQMIEEKLLPAREEELFLGMATAWQLAADYNASDQVCFRFRDRFPKSPLLPTLLFRHAENASFQALAAEKLGDQNVRKNEIVRFNDEALRRYQEVVDKYPKYGHVHLARFGVAMAHYRKGDFEKARSALEAIPAQERGGDLGLVPYYLADVLLRQAPAKVQDAVAARKLEEQLKSAVEQLEAFVGAVPNGSQTADALLKLGYAHQRLGGLRAQQSEKDKAVAAARAAYEQLQQRFPQDPVVPAAIFERAKCLALAKDMNGAMNELRRFQGDPLKASRVAPIACLYLATILRGENKPAEGAQVMEQCRKDQEPLLQNDPTRSSWLSLLQYHHGVCLREAGKHAEARAVLELVVRQGFERPEAGEAALRFGQCQKEEGETKIAEGKKKLVQQNLKPDEQALGSKLLQDGANDVRAAVQYLLGQAEQLREKQPGAEVRARMLYEVARGSRALADLEVEDARSKIQQELWQKAREEAAKKTPPGQHPPVVAPPAVPLEMIPLQPAEGQARVHYQALISAFPEVKINADARFELAEMLGERGEHDAAIKLLREALAKKPPPELAEKIRLRLGDALLVKSDARGALAQFNPIATNAMSPLAAQAIYRAGEAHLALKNPAEAVKRFAAFRDQDHLQNLPTLAERALLRLGYALGLLKQWEPSRQAYEQVVNRFGNGPWANDARYGIGWAYQSTGQWDEAVNWYSQVTANTVNELAARAQMNIGLCRLAQKRYPEATTALLVVPFTYDYPHLSALALVEAARGFAENNQQDQAAKLLERVLRDYPGTEPAEAARKRLAELNKHSK
jgi:TolA-binding protein